MTEPPPPAAKPAVSLSTASLTYGAELVGTMSPPQTLTLTNTGRGALHVSAITVSGDFAESDTCVGVITPESSCALNLSFVPALGGARPGTLTISNDAPDAPHVVALSGTAVSGVTLAITPAQQLMTVNQTQSFSANLAVVWDVDGITAGNQAVGTITAAGLYTPASAGGAHLIGAAGSGMTAHASVVVSSMPGVFTWHNGNARTGANTHEIVLTPQNVKASTFGKLFSVALDGYAYAQPLYVLDVDMQGASRNVVYVASEHDSVYAIDAQSGTVYWKKSLIDPAHGVTTVPSGDLHCTDLVPEVGITSTPVIDRASGTLYVLARTKENGAYAQRLHALDLASGAEKFGGPVAIAATLDVNGNQLIFDPLIEHQRAALTLTQGHVVIGWTSLCDYGDYHGWLMSYNAATLAQEAVFNPTPGGSAGAIWMSGAGPAADDAGNLYFATGNGTFDDRSNLGDSIVRIPPPPAGGAAWDAADWFTPYNEDYLNFEDLDQGSGGVILLPDPGAGAAHRNLVVQAGKDGIIHLLDRDGMGKFCAACTVGNTNTVEEITGQLAGMWDSPAYWNGNLYFGASFEPFPGDNLKAFSFNADGRGLISAAPTSQSAEVFDFPGSTPAVSSNGEGAGIVWAVDDSYFQFPCCQVLYAYDALDVSRMLYNSGQAANQRDVPGGAVKFVVPTIANGRVYVGGQGVLNAYGLLP